MIDANLNIGNMLEELLIYVFILFDIENTKRTYGSGDNGVYYNIINTISGITKKE